MPNHYIEGIDIGRCLTVNEYLTALPAELRPGYELLMQFTLQGLDTWAKQNNDELGAPQVVIVNSIEVNAEGIRGLIRISHGLIRHCFEVNLAPILDCFPMSPSLALGLALHPLYPNLLMLSWVVLHEYTHGIRNHSEAGIELGNDSLTNQALEMDADLTGTSGVYALAKPGLKFYATDMEIRHLIFACIFLVLRTLTSFCKRSTHSILAVRYFHISGKLAQLPERNGVSDYEAKLISTRHRFQLLGETFAKCEQEFLRSPNYHPSFGNVAREWLELHDNGQLFDVTNRWQEMRLRVSELNGNPRDIEIERRIALENQQS